MMTKGELINLLEQYSDDQYVMVVLHAQPGLITERHQLILQGVTDFRPWHPEGGGQKLIGLLVHRENAIIKDRDKDLSPGPVRERL